MTSKKDARIAELERQLVEARAAQIHNLHFSSHALAKASEKHMKGSAVILTISAIGGREITGPIMINNGLSQETIAALEADMVRSWNEVLVYKPKGAA